MKQTVFICLSGGVDSSVAALLLQQNPAYQLKAVFMQNWDPLVNHETTPPVTSKSGCSVAQDLAVVETICAQLKLDLLKFNFVREYYDYVFDLMLKQINRNWTPNPDVFCNKYIKFGFLLQKLLTLEPTARIATGHYAKVIANPDRSFDLGLSRDPHKDQTYFLSQLTQQQLKHVLFPLAELLKTDVRLLAQQHGLVNWNRKDSTGICFIGKRKYQPFLQNYLPPKPGLIIDITTQKVLGEHAGVHFYTLNQRKNLGVHGRLEPYFVVAKDQSQNILYVCTKSLKAIYLTTTTTKITNYHWINQPLLFNQHYYFRLRHLGMLHLVKVIAITPTTLVLTHQPIEKAADGQFAVFYDLQLVRCLGSGIINNNLK